MNFFQVFQERLKLHESRAYSDRTIVSSIAKDRHFERMYLAAIRMLLCETRPRNVEQVGFHLYHYGPQQNTDLGNANEGMGPSTRNIDNSTCRQPRSIFWVRPIRGDLCGCLDVGPLSQTLRHSHHHDRHREHLFCRY